MRPLPRRWSAIAVLIVCFLVAGCATTGYVGLPTAPFGPVETGDRVEIVTVAGETITGKVTAREPEALMVDGRRLTLAEMASLAVQREDTARTGGTIMSAASGVILGPIVALSVLLILVAPAMLMGA
jgi:hypothetical protein